MVGSEPLPVLHLLSLALAVAALLWLRRLSNQVEVLQRRLERVEPQKHASPHETTAATKQTVGKTEATYAVPTRSAPQTDRGTIARLKRNLKRKAREPSREGAIRKPNWMVWLGGVSVALAGVFLVKYSIDQGLLTPWTRVVLAICTGFAMHALAEWLPIRTGGRHPAFSALAAAGSVTLCAATLAALHLYELIPPLAAFAFLAFVSVATTSLALKHGPVFAALGMIGSYAVPLLVGGDSGRIVGVLLYTLIVSATVLLVIRYVYRAWLWWGMVAGGILWWLLSMGGNDADGYRGFYLALLAAEILWLPSLDWWRRSGVANALGAGWRASADRGTGYSDAIGASIRSALIALTLMQGFSIATEPFSVLAAISWAPLVGVLFLAARFRSRCVSLPWLSLAIHGAAWITTALKIDDFQIRWVATIPEVKSGLPIFAAAMGTAYPLLARWNLRGSESVSLWASLAVASPVCWLGIAFAAATDREPSWEWALASAVLGLLYWLVGRKLFRDGLYSIASWTILGLSGAYSLAAVAAFRDAGLTLALAVQAVPLAWLAVRHKASSVEWMTKAVLGAIVVRLTLNPWLPSYLGRILLDSVDLRRLDTRLSRRELDGEAFAEAPAVDGGGGGPLARANLLARDEAVALQRQCVRRGVRLARSRDQHGDLGRIGIDLLLAFASQRANLGGLSVGVSGSAGNVPMELCTRAAIPEPTMGP